MAKFPLSKSESNVIFEDDASKLEILKKGENSFCFKLSTMGADVFTSTFNLVDLEIMSERISEYLCDEQEGD